MEEKASNNEDLNGSSIKNSKSITGYKSDQESIIHKEDMCKDEPPEIFNLKKALKYFKTAKEYKFIYLVYAVSKESKYFSPYSFKIVKFKDIDKNCFFTLSNKGMMSNIQNEVTFMPLTRFEEDYNNYQKLVKLRLFKNYLLWKCFYFWYKHISRNKFYWAREELLVAYDCLRHATVDIFNALLETTEIIILYDGSITEENTLQGFKQQQEKSTELAILKLKHLRQTIKDLVLNACLKALKESGFTVDDSNLYISKMTEKAKIERYRDTTYAMPFAKQRAKLKCCQRICRFIMSIDLILQSHLHTIIRNHITRFETDVRNHFKYIPSNDLLNDSNVETILENERCSDDPRSPLFILEVLLTKTGIEFNSTQHDFNSYISFLLESWKWNMVTHIPPLLSDNEFNSFTQPKICGKQNNRICGNGTLLQFMFDIDDMYQSSTEKILNYFDANYDAVYKYLKRLEYVHIMYRENEELDPGTIENETNVINFRKMLEKYRRQRNYVDKITPAQMLAIFCLKLNLFKSVAKSSCEKLLELVEKTMVKAGKNLVNELLNEINDSLKYLHTPPSTAAQCVVYKKFLEKCSKRLEEIDNILNYIRDLYDLADEFEIPVPEDDIENYNKFSIVLTNLQTTFDEINNEQDKLMDEFVKKIDIHIADILREVNQINIEANDSWLTDISSNKEEVKLFLFKLNNRLMERQEEANLYTSYQQFFGVEVAKFDVLKNASESVRLRILLWDCLDEWEKKMSVWEEDNFHNLDVEEMYTFLTLNLKYVMEFKKGLPDCEYINFLNNKVETFKQKMSIIKILRNPDLKPHHWIEIEQKLGTKFPTNKSLTLIMLEELGAFNHGLELIEISGHASSEATMLTILNKVEDSWKKIELIVLPYKNADDVFILGSLEEVQLTLEEANINLNTLITSKYVKMIKTRVEGWINSMNIMNDILTEWTLCQNNWIYLESIFAAPDIQRQLPNEAKLFNQVNSSWKNIMQNVKKYPLAISTCTEPNLLKILIKNNQEIEQILLYLEAYLESKRIIFPRFYFLSNDELIKIITQARYARTVQPYMSKCFDAIWRIQFEKDNEEGNPLQSENEVDSSPTNIIAMISHEREVVKFLSPVKAQGNVEFWLSKVENEMMNTLKSLMIIAIEDYEKIPREKWVLLHATQLVLTVSQLMWCRDVHRIFKLDTNVQQALVKFEQKCFKLSIFDLNDLVVMVQGKLTKLQRSAICALITVNVHSRDIVSVMVKRQVNSETNFEWLKHLRYYWITAVDSCVAYMIDFRWLYAFEYLGSSPRLVITPLTDKCYLCLLGALQLNLGGAPVGPTGVGKTETIKDLAKALATQCVVFNCSKDLDYKAMGKLFSGMAQSGAWCCFDEFNHIEIEVLSVIAQQLITIMNAKMNNVSKFILEGREIRIIKTCAVFITMNPSYAGRSELPDNLQALFRPMAMIVPNYELIAEIILYSEGFESSKMLAHKMVKMYKLCSEQLSTQYHYDFEMRAVKSVLAMAISLKQENPFIKENVILIKALRDCNLPKLLKDDALLFQDILNDIFPGVVLPDQDYGMFYSTVKNIMENEGYKIKECIYIKVLELLKTMIVRHGVMTVGQTGGGKTTVLKILSKTLIELYNNKIEDQYYRPVKIYHINPKAVSMSELYGEVNPLTMEWRDGLLGKCIRETVKTTKEEFQWVVCDGPVDAIWIENLNTMLDDNKMLCLANSDRIKLSSWVRMVFEVDDLSYASPATVSRCGMVHIHPDELGWLPYVQSWVNKFENEVTRNSIELKNYLLKLFETYVDEGFSFIARHCLEPIKQTKISKATMMCAIFKSLLSDPKSFDAETENIEIKKYICQSFIFSYLWALGSNLIDSSQIKFEEFVFNQFKANSEAKILPEIKLFSVYLNTANKTFENWNTIVPDFECKTGTSYFKLLVPTVDSIRYIYIIQKLIQMNQPVMLAGVLGVGKTSVANFVMQNLMKTNDWITKMVMFSAQTSSNRTQEILETTLEKKKRNSFGAPGNNRLAIFIDNVNMPKPEKYGAQPPIELLRQFLDTGGLYDRKKFFWKYVDNVILCTVCTPPGGGRNVLTPRFVRHFSMVFIPTTTENAMRTIFTSILDGFFAEFPSTIANLSINIVKASIAIYLHISKDLLPTPAKPHYVFNLRDLSNTIRGILQADIVTISKPIHLYRLWFHESLRVYHDRLIGHEDKSYVHKLLKSVCAQFFENIVLEFSEYDETGAPILLFGDFMNPISKKNRIYDEITNIEKLKIVLAENLMDFNMVYKKDLEIIFFMNAIEHITRIARILRLERGNALLIGVSGIGKQSLTKLASHLNTYKIFQIELMKSYDYSSFREDLVNLYYKTGVEFEDTTFLFTDNQFIKEEFLEDLSNILSSGEVPNLFKIDDLEKIITTCRQVAINSGINSNHRDAIFTFFIQRVRLKLHLVICMSPNGDSFRRRCRLFPSLVNNLTIDWFDDWPTEVFLSIANKSLEILEKSEDSNTIKSLPKVCNNMHEIVMHYTHRFYEQMKRYNYVTPKSFLEFLKFYMKTHGTQIHKIKNKSERISNGLQKLYETFDMVDAMKTKLKEMAPALLEKNEVTLKLIENLTKEKASVDKVREIVMMEETAAKIKASAAQEIAEDAQRDLTLAMPAMEAAMKALESLNKNDINELRVFNKPPKLVQTVIEAVCLLLAKKTDWTSAKVVLGDVNFLKSLQAYDTDNISDKMINQLKPYIENPDFNPQKVATQSKVAKSLCMWVRAVHSYSLVYRIVEPKRKKQQEAEDELNVVLKELRVKQKLLADAEERLQKLEDIYDQSVAEKNELELNIERTQTRLKRSDLLVVALSDEQHKWEKNIKMFSQRLSTIAGDTLVAAASVNYLGAFTDNYRKEITRLWLTQLTEHGIKHSSNYSLSSILINSFELRLWNICGLSVDSVLTDNAIIVTRTSRRPLMIDPQEQGSSWIKSLEVENSLKICKSTDKDLVNVIVNAIRLGCPILIEGIGEHIDPILRQVLENNIRIQGERTLLRIGITDIEYDNRFRFYITTKLANPNYLPDICILVTLVNFTITPSGLEDQLLTEIVRLEKSDLENRRIQTIVNMNNDNSLLNEMEDKTLRMLYMSEGNILDDEELIETLNNSKETSMIISGRLIDLEETERKIRYERERYSAIAKRGSCLYFVVAQLSEIENMYQFSLKYFKSIFCNAIQHSSNKNTFDEKIQAIVKNMTIDVYINVSRGLFERHKLIFSFLLIVNINLHVGKITNAQWNFLLRGPVGTTKRENRKGPVVLSEEKWKIINYMAEVFPKFKDLPDHCTNYIEIKLGDFIHSIHLDRKNSDISVNWNSLLNSFEKLMLIKSLVNEKLMIAIVNYVSIEFGKSFIENSDVSINSLYKYTSSTMPLIFILSPGSDPFVAFQKFAVEFGMIDKLHAISLGQGQGPKAEKLIKNAKKKGDWIFLQNCHLESSWMLQMENLVQELIGNPSSIGEDFRLFFSSMPSKSFPVFILQNSLKIAYEPPKGLRANLKRLFVDMNVDFFEDNAFKSDWRKMIFGLCFFHAIVLERKKFGSFGWNIPHEFTDSDHECSLLLSHMYCLTAKEIPWDVLQYIVGEIVYGGRIIDPWDQNILKALLRNVFGPQTLETNYKYSSDSSVYFCPESMNCATIDNYLIFIDQLPVIEEPEVFGMHENANMAYQAKETKDMLKTIIEIYPKSQIMHVTLKSDDEIVLEMITDISEKLMKTIIIEQVHFTIMKTDEKGRLLPLSTVLLQEIGRYKELLDVIHSSLHDLRKAIKGHVVMSAELEEVYLSLMKNSVPKTWLNKGYPSLKTLGSWVKDLVLRLDFIDIWMKFGSPPSYWISGLYFPRGFMTGCLQRHARKHNIPIDSLKIDFKLTTTVLVQEEIAAAHAVSLKEEHNVYKGLMTQDDGVYIHGLFLEGGRIDLNTKRLVDPIHGDMNPLLPVIHLVAVVDLDENCERYNCPMYITGSRGELISTTRYTNNYVISVLLPTDFPDNYWILKGTALITQLTN